MNPHTICRVCISNKTEMVSIFDSYNFSMHNCEIFKVITDCASVQIEKFDGFSETICRKCLDHLCQAYSFKKLCEESDYKFRNNFVESYEIKSEFYEWKPINAEIHNCIDENPVERSKTTDCVLTEVKQEFYEEDTKIAYGGDHDNITEFTEERSKITDFLLIEVKQEQSKDEIGNENKPDDSKQEKLSGNKSKECEDPSQSKIERKSYKCDFCAKKFTTNGNLAAHMRLHTGEKPHKCNVCKKLFTSTANLAAHLKLHTGEKSYKCEVCYKKFASSSNLAVHVRSHTGEKPFECHLCAKKFSQSSNLETHVGQHRGAKSLKCNFCDKNFAHRGSLAAHINLHTRENLFKCGFCEKTFVQSGNLAIHVRMHTGEKPYKCDFCGRKFAKNSTLSYHINTVHV